MAELLEGLAEVETQDTTAPSERERDPVSISDEATPLYAVDSALNPALLPTNGKKRTRQRLLRGIQRISSSPSLAQLGRSRAHSAPYGPGRGSFSCVSLSTGVAASSAAAMGSPLAAAHLFSAAVPLSPTTPSSSAGHPSLPGSPTDEAASIQGRLAGFKRDGGANVSMSPLSPSMSLPADVRASLGLKETAAHAATRGRAATMSAAVRKKAPFQFWARAPREIKIHIFSFFEAKELVRISVVSRQFHETCFDGQLWTRFDASEFYQDIPAESLAKIIVAAGPFVKDLNLRGCVQVEHYKRAEVVVKACRNLMNATLEGCRNFQRSTLHSLLKTNEKLTNLNLTGLTAVTNGTCRIIAQSCPQLEMFNVSWCSQMDARGIRAVVESCNLLKDLRCGEIRGFDDVSVAQALFDTNRLERLVLSGCADLSDAAFRTMLHGTDPEVDILTDLPVVPPRRLRHLDISRCSSLTTHGVGALGHCAPDLEGLQLNGLKVVTDAALEPILASSPRLTHLELEELELLTNALLSEHLAKAPCAPNLEHLGLSYCENLSDSGVLHVVRACTSLRSIDLDNTRISDLTLAEAAAMVRARAQRTTSRAACRPRVGLAMVVYDCQNVTWTGIREVLSRNAEVKQRLKMMPVAAVDQHHQLAQISTAQSAIGTAPSPVSSSSSSSSTTSGRSTPSALSPVSTTPPPPDALTTIPTAQHHHQQPHFIPTYPTEIIALKCFYGWQMTVDEHTKRVLRGDLAAASRLERKWADYMQANEEAGAQGAGSRRRRRRAREAAQLAADEEEGGAGAGVWGGAAGANQGQAGAGVGRRRARTAGCAVM